MGGDVSLCFSPKIKGAFCNNSLKILIDIKPPPGVSVLSAGVCFFSVCVCLGGFYLLIKTAI